MNDSKGNLPCEIEDTFEGYFAARDFVNSAPKMSRDEFEDALMEKVLAVHGGDILQLSTHDILTANTTFKFFLNRWLKNQIRGVEVDIVNTIEDQAKQIIDPDGVIVANRHVIELSLRDLGLTSLPITFGGLSHLKKLDLANNKLTDLPDSFRLLKQLVELNIVDNKFVKCPEILKDIPSLMLTNLGNSLTSSLSSSRSSLEKDFLLGFRKILRKSKIIDILDITETELDSGVSCPTDDGFLHISLKSLINHPYITYLSIGGTNIQKIHHSDVITNCPDLKNLEIYGNQIIEFDLSVLRNSLKLKNIVLSHNLIESLDLAPIKSLPQLEYIDLSRNMIKEVNLQSLIELQSLVEFSVGGNPIEELDISPIFNCSSLLRFKLNTPHFLYYSNPLRDTGGWGPIKKVIFPSPPATKFLSGLQIFCDFETEVVFDSTYYKESECSNVYKIFTVK